MAAELYALAARHCFSRWRPGAAQARLEALLAVCQSSLDRAAVTLPLDRTRDPLGELRPLLGPAHGLV